MGNAASSRKKPPAPPPPGRGRRARDAAGQCDGERQEPRQPPARHGVQERRPALQPVGAQGRERGQAQPWSLRRTAASAEARRGAPAPGCDPTGAGWVTALMPRSAPRPAGRAQRPAPNRNPRHPLTDNAGSIGPRTPAGRPATNAGRERRAGGAGGGGSAGPPGARRARRRRRSWRPPWWRSTCSAGPRPGGRPAPPPTTASRAYAAGHAASSRSILVARCSPGSSRPQPPAGPDPAPARPRPARRHRADPTAPTFAGIRASRTISGRESPSACRRRSIRPAPRATAGQ